MIKQKCFGPQISKITSFLQVKKSIGCMNDKPGNTKGGSITVPLTSCLTGLESAI
jgi:hypothetical protein